MSWKDTIHDWNAEVTVDEKKEAYSALVSRPEFADLHRILRGMQIDCWTMAQSMRERDRQDFLLGKAEMIDDIINDIAAIAD
jgi:hypothetical protein